MCSSDLLIGAQGPPIATSSVGCCGQYGSIAESVLQSIILITSMETTVWTFNLSVPFAEWAAIYDSDDVAKMHAAVGVKSLFRGVSKDDPTKVCAVQQGPVGVAQKIFEDNKEMIRGAGHVIESTVISSYLDA